MPEPSKKVPPSSSVRVRCRTRALRRAASQGGGSAPANPWSGRHRATDCAHIARSRTHSQGREVDRLSRLSYGCRAGAAAAQLTKSRGLVDANFCSEIAPQRLEKIQSRLANCMGSEASNLQYLVQGRAADRCGLGVYDAKFSASQPLEIAENREGISKTSPLPNQPRTRPFTPDGCSERPKSRPFRPARICQAIHAEPFPARASVTRLPPGSRWSIWRPRGPTSLV